MATCKRLFVVGALWEKCITCQSTMIPITNNPPEEIKMNLPGEFEIV